MNKNFTTTILIVNYNSSKFVDISLYSLSKLTKHPYQVFILDNDSEKKDFENLKKIASNYSNVHVSRSKTKLRGSEAHGEGLNKLIKKVNTQYFSIIDADAIWLVKHWDEILIKHIKGKVRVVGTQSSYKNKPMDFPLVYAILFETKTFMEMNINFLPGDLEKFEDVGYEIRRKYFKSGIKSEILPVYNSRFYKKGPFNKMIGISEYYFSTNRKQIIAAHFGRGSMSGSPKYLQGFGLLAYSLPFIGKKMLQLKFINDRNNWIKICRQLVDKEASRK